MKVAIGKQTFIERWNSVARQQALWRYLNLKNYLSPVAAGFTISNDILYSLIVSKKKKKNQLNSRNEKITKIFCHTDTKYSSSNLAVVNNLRRCIM